MDHSRYYPFNKTSNPDRGNEYYRSHIASLYERCLRQESHRNSLYIGLLGTRCYLPYRVATSTSFGLDLISSRKQRDVHDKAHIDQLRWDLLDKALSFAEQVVRKHASSRTQRVSLLEGDLVGALAMKIVTCNAMLSLATSLHNISSSTISAMQSDMESCKAELLRFGKSDVMQLPPSECEILYGRAGYLKALAFVRKETSDPDFGIIMARTIIGQIWNEGKRISKQLKCSLPLMWEWHSSLYLGAAHGVTGILHTLLDFQKELLQVDECYWATLEQTVLQLNGYCFESGNLVSSIPMSRDFREKTDRLVQFCHGATGHVLLLVQMYGKSGDKKYLNLAKQISESVILPRGLLRKGVGLCHGISGNAYCFLSIHNAELEGSNAKEERESSDWLRYAFMFANFALDNLSDLEHVPDRPYSLYEGLAGLICFLLDLIDLKVGSVSRFPCYEL